MPFGGWMSLSGIRIRKITEKPFTISQYVSLFRNPFIRSLVDKITALALKILWNFQVDPFDLK